MLGLALGPKHAELQAGGEWLVLLDIGKPQLRLTVNLGNLFF